MKTSPGITEVEIDGNIVELEGDLTPEQIQQAVANIRATKAIKPIAERAKANVAPSTGAFLSDKLKQGVGAAVETVGTLGSRFSGASPEDKPRLKEIRKDVEAGLGTQYFQPRNPIEKAAGAGAEFLVEGVADPLTYAFPGGGFVSKIFQNYLPAAVSDFSQTVVERMGGGSGSQLAAGIAGGLAGGLGNAGIDRAARGGGAAFRAAATGKNLVEYANTKVLDQATEHVRNTIREAMKADPKLVEHIAELQNQSRQLGTDLPLSALMENDVIKASIRRLASKDPTFASAFSKQYDDAVKAVKAKQVEMFGDPTTAPSRLQQNLGPNREQRLSGIQERLDERARATGKPLEPYYNAPKLSGQIEKLTTVPEGAVSPKSIPLYQQADGIAADVGASISEGSVADIYRFAKGEMKDSPFERFPSIMGRIRDRFAPIVDPQNPTTRQWNPAMYEEVRSLQREINKEIASLNPNNPSYRQDMSLLTQLKQVVEEKTTKDFPSELSQLLKQAGQQFSYDINLRDFSRSVFDNNGIMHPNKVRNWLSDESNVKALFNVVDPATGKTLGSVVSTPAAAVARIMERKDYVNSIYTQMQKQRILDVAKMAPDEIVDRMYKDPKFISQFMNKYGKNKDTLMALRGFMMDDVMRSKDPLNVLMNDKAKAEALNRVFGPGYTTQVKELADLATRLANNPANISFNVDAGVKKDVMEEMTGIPISMVVSKLRNPIISKRQAFVELASKSWTGRAGIQFDEKMKQLWLDPESVKTLASMLKNIEAGNPVTGKAAKDIVQFLSGEVATTGQMAGRGAYVGSKVEQEEQQNE